MSSSLALAVRGVSKEYTIRHNRAKHTTLAEMLMHRVRHPFEQSQRETFRALNDVSFDVHRGEIVGIIGSNGAGKSTLLKILSRITEPSSGEIALYGRVGSLLEVGTGFHPELTGRENVFLNGTLLGMRRPDIVRQFDAIVDFAGVEQFLDTPVKRYSSGMYVRLAFAVAAHLDPEILIIDEVLAVGDAEFQKKSLGKMEEVAKNEGRTVLFVSHNVLAIRDLCSSCVVLRQGERIFYGDTAQALTIYSEQARSQATAAEPDRLRRPAWAQPFITQVSVIDEHGQPQYEHGLGENVCLEVRFQTPPEAIISKPEMGLVVRHAVHGVVGGINTTMTGFDVTHGRYQQGRLRCTLHGMKLLPGRYTFDIWLQDSTIAIDHVQEAAAFVIEATDIYGTGKLPIVTLGLNFLQANWDFQGQ